MVFNLPLVPAAAGGYVVDNSVYGDGSTGYFSRTPAGAGNLNTSTTVMWVKATPVVNEYIFSAGPDANNREIAYFDGNYNVVWLLIVGGVTKWQLTSTPVFRDPAAWEQLQFVRDTTNATAADRVIIYQNGTRLAGTLSTTPALNQNALWGDAVAHYIGRYNAAASNYFAAYYSEYYSIDGQALTPSSFGETDAITGSWKPKAYAGTYGTNGFHLDFTNGADLGNDVSGNNNDFTKTGTVTQTTDSPTDDAVNNIGNFCTINPLDLQTGMTITLSEGNLRATSSNAGDGSILGTIEFPATGDFYWEVLYNTLGSGSAPMIGVGNKSHSYASYLGSDTNSTGFDSLGRVYYNASPTAYTAPAATETWGFRFKPGAKEFYVGKVSAGTITWLNSGNPVATIGASGPFYSWFQVGNSSNVTVNFGQKAFAISSIPSGAKRLCTANLPAPTIKDSGAHFNVVTYTGTGAALSVTGVGFQPDVVWIKSRSAATDHAVYDAVRGAQKRLETNNTDAEVTTDGGVTSFDADGFTLGTLAQVNTNGATYVAWCWKMNGAGSANTDGTISSTVSANVSAGTSVVAYTGSGANATVGHGLGAVPKLIIVKARSGVQTWVAYHANLTSAAYYIAFNGTAAEVSDATQWNSTAPTSSVFSLGTGGAMNTNGQTAVAYCFAEVPGFSKFGKYVGNGAADGPFVWCGFRPKFVLVKCVDTAATAWMLWDAARNTYNDVDLVLFPQASDADTTDADMVDFLSNGFKLRDAGGDNRNGSGKTYIFAAFAEYPFGGANTTQGKAR